VGQLGPEAGEAWVVPTGWQLGQKAVWAKNERKKENGLQDYFSNFSNKDLILKTKDSNTFKPNLNWNQIGIN
jgi:hypothetical protein